MDKVSLIKYNTYNPCFGGLNSKKSAKIIGAAKSLIPKQDNGKIFGQESAWRLHEEDAFRKFVNEDEELKELISDEIDMARIYGFFPSINVLLDFRESHKNVSDFFKKIEEKYKIDLTQPPKVYRFIGQSEVDVLKRGDTVHPQSIYGKLDVTINPNFNWNRYRVTFKPKKELSVLNEENDRLGIFRHNPSSNHKYCYHYDSSYTMDDVEKIEEINID